jgi:hypothetical protein
MKKVFCIFSPSRFKKMLRRRFHFASILSSTTTLRFQSSSTPDVDLLSVLNEAVQQNTNMNSKESQNKLELFQHFSILQPKPAPASLPYLLPPRWVNIVTDTVEEHFGYQLVQKSITATEEEVFKSAEQSSQKTEESQPKRKVPRPELFLQSFVHPSFLRDYEKRKFMKSENDNDETTTQVENIDRSMTSLAEVGEKVLQYSILVIAPLLVNDENTGVHQNYSSKPKTTKQHDFVVFPIQPDFVDRTHEQENKSSSKKKELSVFVSKTFCDPQQTQKNVNELSKAISSDHALSLVCFNVWKTSELVLTDAGIYGLRDALKVNAATKKSVNLEVGQTGGRNITQTVMKSPPLPMPAAAMNVKAVIGAVYLNFGSDEAVRFCQMHVLCHAVRMVE